MALNNSHDIVVNLEREGEKLTIEQVITAQPGQRARIYYKAAWHPDSPWNARNGTIINANSKMIFFKADNSNSIVIYIDKIFLPEVFFSRLQSGDYYYTFDLIESKV